MRTIGYEEGMEIAEKIRVIQALKYCKSIGYSIKNILHIDSYDLDIHYIRESAIECILDVMIGKGDYLMYQATKEDGDNVGYELYYDEDELSINAIQLKSEPILKYMKLLKKRNIYPYNDNKLCEIIGRISNNEWTDYDMTEGVIGLDYSGIYILTTYFTIDFIDLVDTIDDMIRLCERRIKEYNKGICSLIGKDRDDNNVFLKKPKKKRKRSWDNRDEWKDKLIQKRLNKMMGGYGNGTKRCA